MGSRDAYIRCVWWLTSMYGEVRRPGFSERRQSLVQLWYGWELPVHGHGTLPIGRASEVRHRINVRRPCRTQEQCS
jgi:hypothetical protein